MNKYFLAPVFGFMVLMTVIPTIVAQSWKEPHLYYTEKWCSNCGYKVDVTAKPGDRCPHCGVRWDAEKRVGPRTSQEISDDIENFSYVAWVLISVVVVALAAEYVWDRVKHRGEARVQSLTLHNHGEGHGDNV
jgi:hypothetical protein